MLYGSNAGTSQAFAQRIANDARSRGYAAGVDSLDSAAGHLPTDGAVVIVTSSYEGQPPDNARDFVSWVQTVAPGALDGVRYAVFGCGNKDWARTYQAIPKAVDERAGRGRGAAAGRARRGQRPRRLLRRVRGLVRGFLGPGRGRVRPAVRPRRHRPRRCRWSSSAASRDPILRQNGLQLGTVVANRELVDMSVPDARSKRHLEIALPAGMTYRTGDYLAVLPLNPAAAVDRALSEFELAYDAQLVIHPNAHTGTYLPTDTPVTAGELLSSYVELSQPATRRQLGQLADDRRPARRRSRRCGPWPTTRTGTPRRSSTSGSPCWTCWSATRPASSRSPPTCRCWPR